MSENADGRGHRRDHKWPWPARLLVAVLLLPLWAAVILASEDNFGFIGAWFDPLMIGILIAVAVTVWITTSRSQR